MVIAKPITGVYRTIKNRIRLILFAVFIVIPYIRINDIPLVLLDIPARKFYIFGLVIWPQELYFLHLLLLMAGLTLFLVTALFGRIWCGYACPQTLFTELYDGVAKLVTGNEYGKTSAKGQLSPSVRAWVYFVWAVLSILLSLQFLGYFVPYEQIIADLRSFNFFEEGAPTASLVFMVLSSGAAWGNMALLRENMCKMVCPYGRFQTALLDKDSPIVSYNLNRGEPRRIKATQKVGQHDGDCIDCDLCVMVCPTGIDIRDGLQVGCLSCGLCVDACSIVMNKLDKPTLIKYQPLEQTNKRPHYVRPRTVTYGLLLGLALTLFSFLLFVRIPFYADATLDKAIPATYIPATGWQNGYEFHIGNKSHNDVQLSISTDNQIDYRIIGVEEG
ncbi:MAG: cytochrome c oxidase accessory protein CcoG, partial [Leptonema sp. (in: Bacteria)]|nr:cytochrome c oxidase accessory protein CcoG [Leptonema sp. (in: bacteria)]